MPGPADLEELARDMRVGRKTADNQRSGPVRREPVEPSKFETWRSNPEISREEDVALSASLHFEGHKAGGPRHHRPRSARERERKWEVFLTAALKVSWRQLQNYLRPQDHVPFAINLCLALSVQSFTCPILANLLNILHQQHAQLFHHSFPQKSRIFAFFLRLATAQVQP